MTEELKQLREALRRVKHEAASLADAQVIALEALTQPAAQAECVGCEGKPSATNSPCAVCMGAQQAERIAELEARVHTCGPTCSKAGCINLRLAAERDTLRAEVERLKPNAERYEWLRDNHESDWAICEWQDDPDGLGYYRDARLPSIVDTAIDTARKATP